MLIPENTAVIIFLSIIFISMLIAWYFSSYAIFEGHKFHTFIVVFSGLGVIITFLFYYNVLVVQNQNQTTILSENLLKFNKNLFHDLFNELKESSKVVPYFVSSLMPLSFPDRIELEDDKSNIEVYTIITALSYKIFSLWQDYIYFSSFYYNITIHEPEKYIYIFLQQSHSNLLKEQWNQLKHNFHSKTILFGDLLFESNKSIHMNNSDTYKLATATFMENLAYKNLLK